MSGSKGSTTAREIAGSLSREFLGSVIVVDTSGTILAWNDAATRLGVAAGSLAVTRRGGASAIPPGAEVRALVEEVRTGAR